MHDPSTRLIHHPYQPPEGFVAPQPPVHKASTVVFANTAAMRARDWKHKTGYTYGLHGTPTTFTLEERLCALEGGRHCVLVPSGLAAIANTLLALLRHGDHVLMPDNVYGPAKTLAENELARFGIDCDYYDAQNPADLEARMRPATRLVCLEAPGSVTMEFPDLPALLAIGRAHGALTVLDNTWGAGLAFSPFDLGGGQGVDISVHALTKYPSGGGDVLMGSVMTRDDALHQRIKMAHMRLGLGVGANDCEAVLRSLPSIALRYRAHDAAARTLALWLQQQAEVAHVLHPALPGSPGHAHWLALCAGGENDAADPGPPGGAAGLFSVVFDGRFNTAAVDRFCDALRCFRIGYSWGGPLSLVVPYDVTGMRTPSVSKWRPDGVLVRFSVGLERVEDLQADLAQALALLRA